jgi:transmembrane sensor
LIVNRIKGLILRHLRDELTRAERQELMLWLQASAANQLLFDEINDPDRVADAMAKMEAMHEEEVWLRISRGGDNRRFAEGPEEDAAVLFERPPRRIGRYLGVASAVLLLLGVGVYLWKARSSRAEASTLARSAPHDVLPGTNKAILTLSNGERVVLDSAQTGKLATQGNTQVMKADSGRILYNALGERPTAMLFNTLATPRGGQYQLTLPDGTKVWLNAASSIRYPVAFVGPERKVEITGEVYFEVTKNAAQPFKVTVMDKQEVEVLGTSFDINAYDDEKEVATTLLAGSVRVDVGLSTLPVGVNAKNGKEHVVLTPGQRAELNENDRKRGIPLTVQSGVDLEEAVAWTNGKFIFTGNDIGSVMRQIGRWYNVEILYKGDFSGVELVGVISRNKHVSDILGMLEQTRTVQFTIEGRTITVFPYKH